MPPHQRTRPEARTSHGEFSRPRHQHGVHSSSPFLSSPRDEANCGPEPVITASVLALAGPETTLVDHPTPVESPTPEPLQDFKTHWESQGQ